MAHILGDGDDVNDGENESEKGGDEEGAGDPEIVAPPGKQGRATGLLVQGRRFPNRARSGRLSKRRRTQYTTRHPDGRGGEGRGMGVRQVTMMVVVIVRRMGSRKKSVWENKACLAMPLHPTTAGGERRQRSEVDNTLKLI